MSRKAILISAACAAAVVAVAIPAAAYVMTKPSENHLGDTLRSFGYLPIALPTSRMSVGSLYHVDSKVRFFDVACHAEKSDLEGAVESENGGEVRADLLTNGQFETGVKVSVGGLIKGDVAANEKQTVRFSLTEIRVESISLEKNLAIFVKMMEKPNCSRAVTQIINNGGYVCQGQKVLEATADYKLDRDTMNRIGTSTVNTTDVNSIVKLAVETQSGHQVVEREGRVQSGKTLKYAVKMNPDCMAPPTGRFRRVLPESTLGRVTNYVLFHIVEALWPNSDEHTREASLPVEHSAALAPTH
jgi:hypothetical protein